MMLPAHEKFEDGADPLHSAIAKRHFVEQQARFEALASEVEVRYVSPEILKAEREAKKAAEKAKIQKW